MTLHTHWYDTHMYYPRITNLVFTLVQSSFCLTPFTITTVAFGVLIPVSLVDSLLWRSHINQLTYYYSVMWAYPVSIYVLCGYFSCHLDMSRNILAYNRSILVQVTISYH